MHQLVLVNGAKDFRIVEDYKALSFTDDDEVRVIGMGGVHVASKAKGATKASMIAVADAAALALQE